MAEPSTETEPPRSAADESAHRKSRRIDPLSLAALTVVSLAIAIFVTLVIITVFGTEDDDAVDVEDALGNPTALQEDAQQSALEVGSPAPRVDLELLGGGSINTGDLLGRPAVVNFWSSTCAPCLAEMPDFESVHREHGDRVAFLGVDVTDTVEAGTEMVERTGVTYPNARDPRAEAMAAFGGVALPRTVILDADGVVVEAHSGAMTAEELTGALQGAGLL
ncbi:MAG: TlpA disulfide reductase family protein [Microthrixaceae bacterium]